MDTAFIRGGVYSRAAIISHFLSQILRLWKGGICKREAFNPVSTGLRKSRVPRGGGVWNPPPCFFQLFVSLEQQNFVH